VIAMSEEPEKTGGFTRAESVSAIQPAVFRDEDGNRYTVIAYRPYPFLGITDYALDDGTAVKCIDERNFEIEPTGRRITRSDG
jgi:hypothetical protein